MKLPMKLNRLLAAFALIVSVNLAQADDLACPSSPAILKTTKEICLECFFPLRVAGKTTAKGSSWNIPLLAEFTNAICTCPMPLPPYKRIGVPMGVFGVMDMVEVVNTPYCSPMFGLTLTSSKTSNKAGTFGAKTGNALTQKTFAQVHYYTYPFGEVVNEMQSEICLSPNLYPDYSMYSEFLPNWQDDQTASFLYPEAVLYNNPIATFACIADSVGAALGYPLEPLHWCMGSWGSAYPFSGNTITRATHEDSMAIAAKMIELMNRVGSIVYQFGSSPLCCNAWPSAIWFKNAHRIQLVYPVADYKARVIGETDLKWGYGKNVPYESQNYGMLLYQFRECCVF